jgi:quinol monooxygenase YgiN
MPLYSFLRFHILHGKEAAFEAAFQQVLLASRQEPGCIEIHGYRSLRDPHLYYIHSRWQDEAAFDLHAKLPLTLNFIQTVQPLLDHPLEATRTERIG